MRRTSSTFREEVVYYCASSLFVERGQVFFFLIFVVLRIVDVGGKGQKNGATGTIQNHAEELAQHLHNTYAIRFRRPLNSDWLEPLRTHVRSWRFNGCPLNRTIMDRSIKPPRSSQALQNHEQRGTVCPANWRRGEPDMAENHQGVVDWLLNRGKSKGRVDL